MKTIRYHVLDADGGKGWAVVMLFDSLTGRYVVASDHPKGSGRDESETRAGADLEFKQHLRRLDWLKEASDGRLST